MGLNRCYCHEIIKQPDTVVPHGYRHLDVPHINVKEVSFIDPIEIIPLLSIINTVRIPGLTLKHRNIPAISNIVHVFYVNAKKVITTWVEINKKYKILIALYPPTAEKYLKKFERLTTTYFFNHEFCGQPKPL